MPRTKRRGQGEGSLEELPSGKWRAIFSNGKTKDGRQRKVTSPVFATKREADDWLAQQKVDRRMGKLIVPTRIPLETWLKQWLTSMKSRVSPLSLATYERRCEKYLIPELGDCEMAQLDVALIEAAAGRMAERGGSPYAIRMALLTLRQSLKDAVRLKKIFSNPAAEAVLPRDEKREMKFWTLEQARRFLEANREQRLYPLWLLALDTGMRQGELLALRRDQLHLGEGWLDVSQTLEEIDGEFRLKPPKTARSRRRIWVANTTTQALRAMVPYQSSLAGFIFLNRNGRHYHKTKINEAFKNAIKRAGVPRIRFHDLRHTCATLLLAAGVGIKAVSERLGHANVSITLKTYAHVLPGEQKAVSEVTGKLFSPVSHGHPINEVESTKVQVNGINEVFKTAWCYVI
jgi:integrase